MTYGLASESPKLAKDCIVPLFVPGDRPDRFQKAFASGADAVILDWEDAVANENKDLARLTVAEATFDKAKAVLRVNGVHTKWHKDDLSVAVNSGVRTILLPKAEYVEEVVMVIGALPPSTDLILLVETARGLANCRELAGITGISRLAFGSADFCADLGCQPTETALLSARSEIVLASRLAGLSSPLDGVATAIDDVHAVEMEARRGKELGFGGKLSIHPKQIDPVKRGFMPSREETEWARAVLAAGNDGAARVGSQMVDAPVRERARKIMARLEGAGDVT